MNAPTAQAMDEAQVLLAVARHRNSEFHNQLGPVGRAASVFSLATHIVVTAALDEGGRAAVAATGDAAVLTLIATRAATLRDAVAKLAIGGSTLRMGGESNPLLQDVLGLVDSAGADASVLLAIEAQPIAPGRAGEGSRATLAEWVDEAWPRLRQGCIELVLDGGTSTDCITQSFAAVMSHASELDSPIRAGGLGGLRRWPTSAKRGLARKVCAAAVVAVSGSAENGMMTEIALLVSAALDFLSLANGADATAPAPCWRWPGMPEQGAPH